MVLTEYQRVVCRLLASRRTGDGERYVAGGLALGEATASPRFSRDIDLFHDSREAVATSWADDRALLEGAGHAVRVVRERPDFVEAVVSQGPGTVLVQWAPDSAYRFFPLAAHADFGLALHPFDLATNKVLALVGRLEVRDWVDVLDAHDRIQPFALLAWAACGKDPGFSPASILEHAARSSRYTEEELASLEFEGARPTAAALATRWRSLLDGAGAWIAALPPERAGTCVLDGNGAPFRGDLDSLRRSLAAGTTRFRSGSLRGVLPTVRGA